MERIQQLISKYSRLQISIAILVIIFAFIGLLFSSVFVGMRFNLFDVRGSINTRNEFYLNGLNSTSTSTSSAGIIESIQYKLRKEMKDVRKEIFPNTSFAWIETPEWQTLSFALTKDREVIRKAANDAGVNPRLLVSVVIAEQIRFFTSDRETYKKFFEPLKILGTLSKFSLGVSGIKPDTAKLIEVNLKDKNSPFYISKEYENIIDQNSDIYTKLTDDKNHYYSYLYTALFIRQIGSQWKKAGFDISNRPEILATIFNLGFDKSIPKENPEVAGSIIEIGGEKISFGKIAYEFYYSGELIDIFGF